MASFCLTAHFLLDTERKSPCHPLPAQFKVTPGTTSPTQKYLKPGGLAGLQSLSSFRHLSESACLGV